MLRFYFTFTALIFSLFFSNIATAEIYKTVDKNGRITYSDTPPPNTNAKPVELKPINTTPAVVATPNYTPTPTQNMDSPPYQVQLIAPINGTTLMPNERSVTLSASLNQNLQNGDVFVYKIDGEIITKTTEFSYSYNEPPRGEHSLTVEVVNTEGTTLAQSNAINLSVIRPLVKQKSNPAPKR